MIPKRNIVSWVLVGCVVCSCAQATEDATSPPRDWREYRPPADAPLAERFVEATRLLLGTPYKNGPLGEGEGGDIDQDPRIDFERVDCVTYLEQSLALALAPQAADEAEFLPVLDSIRYRGGHVEFLHRNHYMVADWIPANDWLLTDVTSQVGGDHVQTVRRTIDRATFLQGHGAGPRPGVDDAREFEVAYIPSDALAAVAPSIRSGDLIFWVGKAESIFVVHTGLAVRGEDGELLFRHGSSKAGRVLDESLADYAARSGFSIGFLTLRLNEAAERS